MADTAAAGVITGPETASSPESEIKLGAMFQGPQDSYYAETQPLEKTERLEEDEKVALQSMIVRTPDEPILVNGQAYTVAVDTPRLAGAVNDVRTAINSPGHYDPRGLLITLNQTVQTELANGRPRERRNVHSWQDGNLHIQVPKEVHDSGESADALIAKIEESLNRDLSLGLSQNSMLKQALGLRKFWTRLGTVAAIGVGEGVMIATSDGPATELAYRGGLGATIGAVAAGAFVGLKIAIQQARHDSTAAPVAHRVYKRAINQQEKAIQEGKSNPAPILSLAPVQG